MGGRGGTRSEEPGGQSCRERGQEHRGCGAQDGGGRAAATAQLEHAALEVEIFGFFPQFIPQIFGPILAIRQGSDRAAVEILPVPGEGAEKEERQIQDGGGISPERPGDSHPAQSPPWLRDLRARWGPGVLCFKLRAAGAASVPQVPGTGSLFPPSPSSSSSSIPASPSPSLALGPSFLPSPRSRISASLSPSSAPEAAQRDVSGVRGGGLGWLHSLLAALRASRSAL